MIQLKGSGIFFQARSLAQKQATRQSMQRTVGILRHFRFFSTPEQILGLGVLSTPAHRN